MSRVDFSTRILGSDISQGSRDAAETARIEACDMIRRVVAEYLQPDNTLSLEATIDQIATSYDDAPPYMINFHLVVIDLADKIPYHHSSQKKLAELILAFSKSEKWSSKQFETREEGLAKFWDDLWFYLYDEAMEMPGRWAKWTGDAMVYANMHAFLAELEFDDVPLASCFGSTTLTRTFEAELSKYPPNERDALVVGAAQYILRQGPTVYAESVKTRKADDPTPPSLPQKIRKWFSRFKRRPVDDYPYFTWELWQAWKAGFRSVSNSDTYSQTCRDVAERAADTMALQEKMEDW